MRYKKNKTKNYLRSVLSCRKEWDVHRERKTSKSKCT